MFSLHTGPTETGIQRRLQALAAMGHPDEDVAEWLDVAVAEIQRLQAGSGGASLASALAAVYEREAGREGRCSRTRTRARRAGWATGMAWDDIDRDEAPQGVRPQRAPCGWMAPRTARMADYGAAAGNPVEQATRELLTDLVDVGCGFREIAAMLRVSPESVAAEYRALRGGMLTPPANNG